MAEGLQRIYRNGPGYGRIAVDHTIFISISIFCISIMTYALYVVPCRTRPFPPPRSTQFRCISLSLVTEADMAGNAPDPALAARTQLASFGQVDAFMTHSVSKKRHHRCPIHMYRQFAPRHTHTAPIDPALHPPFVG